MAPNTPGPSIPVLIFENKMNKSAGRGHILPVLVTPSTCGQAPYTKATISRTKPPPTSSKQLQDSRTKPQDGEPHGPWVAA